MKFSDFQIFKYIYFSKDYKEPEQRNSEQKLLMPYESRERKAELYQKDEGEGGKRKKLDAEGKGRIKKR